MEQEGDGNCLFRAVGLQVYGDSDSHMEVRRRCMDFMVRVCIIVLLLSHLFTCIIMIIYIILFVRVWLSVYRWS